MDADWKPFKVFVPPPPLTKEQLEPQYKQFEQWAGSFEGEATKEQVQKLFIDGYQAGREGGFEEGYAKAGKETAQHFTAVRDRRPVTEEQLKASEDTNKDLVASEIQNVLQQYQIVPDEVKLDAIFDVLKSRFGIKIDRNRDGR